MKRILCALSAGLLALTMTSCTDEEGARRALEAVGYTHIQITGYSFFTCSKDDFQHTGFTARGVNGAPVSGAVCSGLLFKNHTIRTE